jgi:predicted peroxiredoxin
MSEDKKENIVYVLTKGTDNPEMVIIAFTHAVGALAMDVEAKVVLMGPAVNLAQKGAAKHVKYEGLKPLHELLDNFLEMGGQLYLCTPCVKGRGYDEKTDLIEQAKPIAAAVYTEMLLGANAVVSY